MAGYKVPDWKKSIGQNDTTFVVTIDDVDFVLPKAEWLPSEQVELLGRTGELGMIEVLNQIIPAEFAPDEDGTLAVVKPGLGDAFRPVPIKFANEFIAAWQKDSGIDPGESPASADF